MKPAGTLLLQRRDIAGLLTLDECIAAVEQAFRLYGERKTAPPGMLGIHAGSGAFHIKAGLLPLSRSYFALKANGNFFQNKPRFGMPNIQGVILLSDGENGYPLALMDSIEVTILRTGAATAVAARCLSRPNSKIATICGCGNQGRSQLRALLRARSLERVFAFDADESQARRYAEELSAELGIEIRAVPEPGPAVRQSDICVTCTPSRQAYLRREDLPGGIFLAAVGADSPEKQELDPAVMVSNKIVTDILEQCATAGELHHAIEKGLATRADVHAELGDVVAGVKPGRTSSEEIIIFDSTGTALQDTAAAAAVYEKALAAGKGFLFNFAEAQRPAAGNSQI
jgi:alanine dehydrogenase